MPIKVEIIGLEKLTKISQGFRLAKAVLLLELEKAARRFGAIATGISKKDYLSGPRPEKLGVVTGRLRSSITSETKRTDTGVETTVGTNVVYGRVHEYGFKGMLRVPAHTRMVRKVFGRSVDPHQISVSGFSRLVNLRKRPYLRPAVMEALPAYQENILRILRKISMPDMGAA